MNDTDLLKVLKEVSAGKDTTSFDFFDYLHAVGSPLEALLYARLFWPEFMEMNGMIFLKETITDDEARTRLRKTLALYGGDTKQTEQAFNLVEVPYLFGKRRSETTDEQDEGLAHILAAMWRCRLRELYPDRHFRIDVLSAEDAGDVVSILFYQDKKDVL